MRSHIRLGHMGKTIEAYASDLVEVVDGEVVSVGADNLSLIEDTKDGGTISVSKTPASNKRKRDRTYALLKPQQKEAVDIVLEWLRTPTHLGDRNSIVASLTGIAGSGKSFVTRAIAEEAGREDAYRRKYKSAFFSQRAIAFSRQLKEFHAFHGTEGYEKHEVRYDSNLTRKEKKEAIALYDEIEECQQRVAEAEADKRNWYSVLGLAPVHIAVANLAQAAGISCATLHSFLRMTMKKVAWSAEDNRVLAALKLHKATGTEWTPDQEAMLISLQCQQEDALARRKKLTPTCSPEDFNNTVDLLIVDEAWMGNRDLYGALDRLVIQNPDIYLPKILLVGDPNQLPPVGETLSRASEAQHLFELTQPVRQREGELLNFIMGVLQESDSNQIPYLHQAHCGKSNDLIKLPLYDEQGVYEGGGVLDNFHAQAREAGGYANIRIITTSNKKVLEINQHLFSTMGRRPSDAYHVGDTLITRGPVMRDPKYPERPGATDGAIVFSTSTPIELVEVKPEYKKALSNGEVLRTYGAIARCGQHKGGVVLLHPDDVLRWEEQKTYYYNCAQSTSTRSKKGKRGSEGDRAKAAWRLIGLKNWGQCVELDKLEPSEQGRISTLWSQNHWRRVGLSSGKAISADMYKRLISALWVEYFGVVQTCDNIRLSFCTTVHGTQCQTIPLVIIDLMAFYPRKKYPGQDSTWDELKTYYTAVSRASEQIVLSF